MIRKDKLKTNLDNTLPKTKVNLDTVSKIIDKDARARKKSKI
jgi:hypothetical protein